MKADLVLPVLGLLPAGSRRSVLVKPKISGNALAGRDLDVGRCARSSGARRNSYRVNKSATRESATPTACHQADLGRRGLPA